MLRLIEQWVSSLFGGPPDMGTLMAKATLKSRQRLVSWPKVKRFAKRLRRGDSPPAICVDDGLIVEGHHRYVAGAIVGKFPEERPGRLGTARESVPWAEVEFDLEDWGGD